MEELIGTKVVVDTDSSFLYIGTLKTINDEYLVLDEVDVHDKNDVSVTKEKYIHDATLTGIKKNRKCVYILRNRIVSISGVDDVITF